MKNNHNDPEDCPNIIIIDTSRIPAKELPVWIEQNRPYFACPPVGSRQDIDVELIPQELVGSWLKGNQLYISFDASYKYIECGHLITDPEEIAMVNLAPALDAMSFSDLIAMIERLGGNFGIPNYNAFLHAKLGTNPRISFQMTSDYDCVSNCFSIPLFHSMLYNNPLVNVDDNVIFKCPDGGRFAGKKVTISVVVKPGFVNHYDFSQIPT